MTDEQLTEQLDVAAKSLREAIAKARKTGLKVTLCVPNNCFPDSRTVMNEHFNFHAWRETVIK